MGIVRTRVKHAKALGLKVRKEGTRTPKTFSELQPAEQRFLVHRTPTRADGFDAAALKNLFEETFPDVEIKEATFRTMMTNAVAQRTKEVQRGTLLFQARVKAK